MVLLAHIQHADRVIVDGSHENIIPLGDGEGRSGAKFEGMQNRAFRESEQGGPRSVLLVAYQSLVADKREGTVQEWFESAADRHLVTGGDVNRQDRIPLATSR